MSCDNCECLDCRIERGEISCNDLWEQAHDAGRYTNSFGDFRAWLMEDGMARFQYNTGYNDWVPVQGDECCFDGTFGMLEQMPEFKRNLEVFARRRGWREPEEFRNLQQQYNDSVERVRADYQRYYDAWAQRENELHTQIATLQARLEAAESIQVVDLSTLHEQAD